MLTVKPFNAVRPTRDKVHLVASRSYVSYTVNQLRKKLHENPYSYLHIIHPDIGKSKLHKLDMTERYSLVRKQYEQFVNEEIIVRDTRPSFYLYRQTKNNHSFIGIIAAVAIDDYLEGRVKIHEQTLSRRQEIFTAYLDHTNVNAEPVLLISSRSETLHNIYSHYTSARPEYDFTQVTKVRHELWCIDDAKDVQTIQQIFTQQDALYIADGHHRCASSAALCEKRRAANPQDISSPHNYFLAYIIDESNVKIYAFNRLVKDLNGLSEEQFMNALSKKFTLSETKNPLQDPAVMMYLNKSWYTMKRKDGRAIEAQNISDDILSPVLGIHDLRKDRRVSFMEEPRGHHALKHAVDRGHFAVAFVLQPVSVVTLKRVADDKGTMPPKSTWIEPKLRSGMVIYELG
ncbi:MAG: DUF1015 domain-containing protein [Flavobacteriales bacterium]